VDRPHHNANEKWRIFIAIELPEFIREKLIRHSMKLRELAPGAQASWSRPENVHLTLKFIGEVEQTRAAQLSEATERAAEKCTSFRVGVAGCGAFPPRGAPRVLWIGLNDPQGKLAKLHAELEHECGRVGFAKEIRAFHPHLTLARLRKPDHAKALAAAHQEMQFEGEEFKASEVLVVRSELSSAGSKYTTLSRHSLPETKAN
jgi:RNA 2',3'-cyclic 3'-phosphodiesterase